MIIAFLIALAAPQTAPDAAAETAEQAKRAAGMPTSKDIVERVRLMARWHDCLEYRADALAGDAGMRADRAASIAAMRCQSEQDEFTAAARFTRATDDPEWWAAAQASRVIVAREAAERAAQRQEQE